MNKHIYIKFGHMGEFPCWLLTSMEYLPNTDQKDVENSFIGWKDDKFLFFSSWVVPLPFIPNTSKTSVVCSLSFMVIFYFCSSCCCCCCCCCCCSNHLPTFSKRAGRTGGHGFQKSVFEQGTLPLRGPVLLVLVAVDFCKICNGVHHKDQPLHGKIGPLNNDR